MTSLSPLTTHGGEKPRDNCGNKYYHRYQDERDANVGVVRPNQFESLDKPSDGQGAHQDFQRVGDGVRPESSEKSRVVLNGAVCTLWGDGTALFGFLGFPGARPE